MRKDDTDLHRLLRSAADGGRDNAAAEMPFGFDTRVVALARASGSVLPNGNLDVLRFVRRIGAVAFTILAVASAGAFQQFSGAGDDADETPLSEAYAIADNAIQTEVPELAP